MIVKEKEDNKHLYSIGQKIALTFSALRHKNFRYFWTGQCISLIGTWMQRTAQAWLVYQLTNSPLLLGLLGVFQFGPVLVFSLFAGVIVDRFPKKKLLLFTQSLFMLQALVLTILVWSGSVKYWHILVLAAVYGVAQTLDMPARQSFFIELVGKEDLMNAISLNSTIVNLAKIIGPAFAGFMMFKLGPTVCFLLNALSYVAVLLGLLLIDKEGRAVSKPSGNMIQNIKQGIKYIGEDNTLKVTALIMAIVCTFAMNSDVIIPVFAKSVLGKGAGEYSLLLSAMGVGSLISALLMAGRSRRGLKRIILFYAAFATSFAHIAAGLIPNYIFTMFWVASIGFFNLAFLNMANSTLQLNSSDEYRGRVMSIYALLVQGSTPIGNFYAGAMMERFGGGVGYLMCGVATLILMLVMIFIRKGSSRVNNQTVNS